MSRGEAKKGRDKNVKEECFCEEKDRNRVKGRYLSLSIIVLHF